MKKMVITGINGFIGRNAREYFADEYEITGIDLAEHYGGEGEICYYQCNMAREAAELAALNEIRERVRLPFARLSETLRSAQTARGKVLSLYGFLEELCHCG